MSADLPLAVSMGDPAGIGPDIILKSVQALKGRLPLAVYGDPSVFQARANTLGISTKVVEVHGPKDIGATAPDPSALYIIPCQPCNSTTPGVANPKNGEAILDALEKAIDACLAEEASALVTAPINKKVLYEAGFKHPGHTELLGA